VVAQVEVFETFNPGALVLLEMQNSANHKSYQWRKLYEGRPEQLNQESRINRPKIQVFDEPFDTLRIIMDTGLRYVFCIIANM
jgi:hypothetical protein